MMDMEQNEIRMHLDLTGTWNMRAENAGTDLDERSVRGWREVTIPCTFEHCLPEHIGFRGTCWFERRMIVPVAMQGKRIVLNFQAVNYHAAVWVNGLYAGSNDEGFLPFDIPVSGLCKFGEENVVTVRANNETAAGELPPVHFWRSRGGIVRSVALVAAGWVFIEHVKIMAEPQGGEGHLKIGEGYLKIGEGHLKTGEGHLKIGVSLKNELSSRKPADVTVRISIIGVQEGVLVLHASVAIEPGESHEVVLEGIVPNVSIWSPDAPFLYSAVIEVSMAGKIVDCQTIRFGFRTICVQDGKVRLNGKPVFFNGFNRHEDYPDTRLAINQALSRKDFEEIKKSGANFVRMCHYPHDSEELDWCDELGLLVMDEIPLCALLVEVPGTSTEEARHSLGLTLEHAKSQLRRMIERDINHPSVVFWSVSNETNEKEAGVTEINNTLMRLAKKLDPSRLAMHVSMEPYWTSGLMEKLYEYDDVICINEYSPMHERLHLRNEHYGPTDAERYWTGHTARFAAAYPGKPIFVTEFGYQTGHWLDGIEDEEMQARMIATDYSAMRPHVCGALVWCYADHAWPLLLPGRIPVFGRDISLYGVMTRDRKKKTAFDIYKKMIGE